MTMTIDRAEFIRRCDEDLITCSREGAICALEGRMLDVVRWQMKVTQLLTLKRHTGCTHDADLDPFEKCRGEIMKEQPTLDAVRNAFEEAYSAAAHAEQVFEHGLPKRYVMGVDPAVPGSEFTVAHIQAVTKKLEAANPREPTYGSYARTQFGAGMKTIVMLGHALEAAKNRTAEHVIIATSQGDFELRRFTPGECIPHRGPNPAMVLREDTTNMGDYAERLDKMGYKRGFQDAQKMIARPIYKDHGNGVRECVGHEEPIAFDNSTRAKHMRECADRHGHVLKASEPSGSGWREEGAAAHAARKHRDALEEKGETFIAHAFVCHEADEVLIIDRTERGRIPGRAVILTGAAWEEWHKAWGREPTSKDLSLIFDHANGYVHAMHPNQRQIEDLTKEAEKTCSGIAIANLYEAQGFTIKQEMKSVDPERIAKLFAEDLARAQSDRKVRF